MKPFIYTITLLVFSTPLLQAQTRKFSYSEMKMGSAFNLIIVSTDSNKANHLARKSYELVEELESTFDPAENIDGEFTYRRGFLFKRKK